MILRRLEARNFLSLSEADLDLSKPGLTLIEGVNEDESYSLSNGSGKSSLIEALYWGLYGTTIRDSAADDVVNWAAGADCTVVVEFSVGAHNYRVERYRQRTEGDRKHGVTFTSGEEDLTAHRTADTQKRIEEVIGLSPDVFRQTVVLEGGLKVSFSQMTDAARKDFLEQVTGLGFWERFQKTALRAHRSLVQSLDIERESLESAEGRLEDVRAKRDEIVAQESVESLQKDRETAAQEAEEEIAPLRTRLASAKVRVRNLTPLRAEMQERKREVDTRLDDAKSSLAYWDGEKRRAGAALESRQSFLDAETCPTCFQPVREDHPEVLHAFSEDFGVLHAAARQREEARAEEQEAREALRVWEEENREVEENFEEARGEVQTLGAELVAAERARDARLVQLDERILSRQSVEQKLGDLVDAAEENVRACRTTVNALEAREGYLAFWKEETPKLRARVMEHVLGYLNDRLRDYAAILSDGEEVVELSLTDADKVTVETRVGTEVRRHGLRSSGERRRTDLCVQFALNDLAVTSSGGRVPPLLVLDEVLDTLDAVSIARVLELLRIRAEDHGMSVFVTTHNPDVRTALPASASVLTVRKTGGVSTVE